MGTLNPDNTQKQEFDDSGYVQDDTASKEAAAPEQVPDKVTVSLLDLSDDVLLYILKHLSPWDLKALGYTCSRLGALILDRTLWQSVDARDQPCGQLRLRWLLTHALSQHTSSLRVAGFAREAAGCIGYVDSAPTPKDNVNVPGAAASVDDNFPENLNYSTGLSRYASGISGPWGDPPVITGIDPRPNTPGYACPGPQITFTPAALIRLYRVCPNLTDLALDHCVIDCNATKASMFPPSIKKLSLRGTKCFNVEKSFLSRLHDQFKNLEELDVSECDWIEPSYMLPLSKMLRLERLFMTDCYKLSEFVAYASLATRYGFKCLKVMDLRRSPVGDSEVSAFGWVPNLEELYLEASPLPLRPPPHGHCSWLPRPQHKELKDWEEKEPEYYENKNASQFWTHQDNMDTRNSFSSLRNPLRPSPMRANTLTPEEVYNATRNFSYTRPNNNNSDGVRAQPGSSQSNQRNKQPGTRDQSTSTESNQSGESSSHKDQATSPVRNEQFDQKANDSSQTQQPSTSRQGCSANEETGPDTAKKSNDFKHRDKPSKYKAYFPVFKSDSRKQKWNDGDDLDDDDDDNNDDDDSKFDQDAAPIKAEPLKKDIKDYDNQQASGSSQLDTPSTSRNEPAQNNQRNEQNAPNFRPGFAQRRSELMNVNRRLNYLRDRVVNFNHCMGHNFNCQMNDYDRVVQMNELRLGTAESFSASLAALSSHLDKRLSRNQPGRPAHISAENQPLMLRENNNGESQEGIVEYEVLEREGDRQDEIDRSKVKENENREENAWKRKQEDLEEAGSSKRNRNEPSTSGAGVAFSVEQNEPKTEDSLENEPSSTNSGTNGVSKPEHCTTKAARKYYDDQNCDLNHANNINGVQSDDHRHPGSLVDDEASNSDDDDDEPKRKWPRTGGSQNGQSSIEQPSTSSSLRPNFDPIITTIELSSRHVDFGDENSEASEASQLNDTKESNQQNQSSHNDDIDNDDVRKNIDNDRDVRPNNQFGRNRNARVQLERNVVPQEDRGRVWYNIFERREENRERNNTLGLPPLDRDPAQPPLIDEMARQHILYVNVSRMRHAMCQIDQQLPVNNQRERLPNAFRYYLHTSTMAPRLEYSSLVTDAAIRRFGHADNENITYLHLGPGRYDDPHARPNRSNLRILSVVGFRHITNFSLTHLATAAPRLEVLDVRGTAVTDVGVEHFKNSKPNCTVRFGPLNTPEEDGNKH